MFARLPLHNSLQVEGLGWWKFHYDAWRACSSTVQTLHKHKLSCSTKCQAHLNKSSWSERVFLKQQR